MQAGAEAGERKHADLTGLLVEFARARKGLSFYAEGHAARADLVDRAWMAWQLGIQRAGAIELVCEADGLRFAGGEEPMRSAPLDELQQALSDRAVETLRFDSSMTRDAFAALLDLLGRPPEYVSNCGGLGPALATRCDHGIRINGGPAEHGSAPGSTATPVTSLGAGLLVSTRDLVSRPGLLESDEKPEIDDDPLAAPAHDEAAETLRRQLVELDRTTEEGRYAEGVRQICQRAVVLFDEGRSDDIYRAVLVLADHAVGEGGRSALQALAAHDALSQLCHGGALDDLIDRACSTEGRHSVRASRVLLQHGPDAAERVLARVVAEVDPDRLAQLRAILMALGEHAGRSLEHTLDEAPAAHASVAARLCGDSQNPALIPALARSLRRDAPALRRAAVSALVQIGGRPSGDALLNEISRNDPELVRVCGHGLGQLGEDRFVLPLLAALDRAERRGDASLAGDLVRDLGRLGSDRAVPRLASMLRRRRLLARAPKLQLQMRALETLAALPGREARRTVEWTAKQGPRGLRNHAKSLLADDEPAGDDSRLAD